MLKSTLFRIYSNNIRRNICLSAIRSRPLITLQTTIEKAKIPDNFEVDFCKILGKTLVKDEKILRIILQTYYVTEFTEITTYSNRIEINFPLEISEGLMMFLTLNTGESIYRPSRPHEQSSEVVVVNVKAVGVFGVAEGNLGYARTLIPYLSSTLDVDTSRIFLHFDAIERKDVGHLIYHDNL